MAVCGDYFEVNKDIFSHATAIGDTLRDIAHEFAKRWVERFAGTKDYSAIHIVGYEPSTEYETNVPQMWFWTNWAGPKDNDFYSESHLKSNLATFNQPIPKDNHLPHKMTEHGMPKPDYREEGAAVRAFLNATSPYFTWNGDTRYWLSAVNAVVSVMNLLAPSIRDMPDDKICDLGVYSLEFLVNIGSMTPNSTVGLSGERECDIIIVTPEQVKFNRRAKLNDD